MVLRGTKLDGMKCGCCFPAQIGYAFRRNCGKVPYFHNISLSLYDMTSFHSFGLAWVLKGRFTAPVLSACYESRAHRTSCRPFIEEGVHNFKVLRYFVTTASPDFTSYHPYLGASFKIEACIFLGLFPILATDKLNQRHRRASRLRHLVCLVFFPFANS
ncbi:uncharacterized protein BDR25DRAFT_350256 [Lindgomyces ingoldianus]|uniref:Uncharacterized protein n=1 Tax=Lindgomyces ingoldianus TaxID=673940 RepID=A0ACB6RBS5_9PLEO|nr:uncharacterized protein BDR25DRAFT_350256 [Lindgomyces ingoldianus]KAF2475977.1 hypothetical protein BDR25DRAFT_350256 [Lindgomyces ingoldianus]